MKVSLSMTRDGERQVAPPLSKATSILVACSPWTSTPLLTFESTWAQGYTQQ